MFSVLSWGSQDLQRKFKSSKLFYLELQTEG